MVSKISAAFSSLFGLDFQVPIKNWRSTIRKTKTSSWSYFFVRLFAKLPALLLPRCVESWCSKKVSKLIKYQKPSADAINGIGIEILQITAKRVTSFSAGQEEIKSLDEKYKSALEKVTLALQNADKSVLAALEKHRGGNADLNAKKHFVKIVEYLDQNKHEPQTEKHALRTLVMMTVPLPFKAPNVESLEQLQALGNQTGRITGSTKCKCIYQKNQPVAKVRTSVSANGKLTNEVDAYNFNALLGGTTVPAAIFANGRVLQEYLDNSHSLENVLKDKHLEFINKWGLADAQLYFTLALLRGRGDGHHDNVLFVPSGEESSCFDIDLEEDFIPFNINIIEGNERSAVKLWTLGLPCAGEPYLKIMMMLFCWPGMIERILQHNFHLDENQKKALAERISQVIEIFEFERTKKDSKFSPRDLFFLLHGKNWAYHNLVESGVTPYQVFASFSPKTSDRRLALDKLPKDNPLTEACETMASKDPDKGLWKKYKAKKEDKETVPYPFPYKNKTDKYPGACMTDNAKESLQKTGKWKSVETFEIQKIDLSGWQSYRDKCSKAGQRPMNFMLAHFISEPYFKRMARQFAHIFPSHSLGVHADGDTVYLTLEGTSSRGIAQSQT